jgi:divalent metal cation (Fe/Co/Zn/Cd) transporter
MAGYITVDILGVPVEAYTSVAVSLPGWFYLVGGTGFMAVGMFIYVLLVGAIWNKIRRLNLRILPVAHALFLFWAYSVAVEGTLDDQVFSFIAIAASIFICEWLIRYFEKMPRRSQLRLNNL